MSCDFPLSMTSWDTLYLKIPVVRLAVNTDQVHGSDKTKGLDSINVKPCGAMMQTREKYIIGNVSGFSSYLQYCGT